MRPRTNLLLLGIAVLLTAYAAIFETGSPAFLARGRAFKDLEPGEIQEIEISRPASAKDAAVGVDVRPIKLRREGTPPEWWIVEPIRFEAYHPRAESIAYDIADLARLADVSVEAEAAAFRGEPEILVQFKTRSGKDHAIEVGPDHPDEKLDLAYCRVDGEAFVTRREIRKNVLVSLTELRTRSLLGIAPSDAVFVAVSGDPRLEKTIEREGASDVWRLKKPIDAQADTELVENLLKALNSWAVTTFVTDAARDQDLAAYGLDRPRAAVTLRHRSGREITLEVGKDLDLAPVQDTAPQVYVRHAGQPFVFAASNEPLKRIYWGFEFFRSRYVFDLGLDEVESLEGQMGGDVVRLKREKANEKDKANEKGGKAYAWQVLDATGSPIFPGDRQEIEGVIVGLRKLLIHKFLGGQLTSPEGHLALRTAGGRKLEIQIGTVSEAAEDRGKNMYPVFLRGEPGPFLVSTVLPAKLAEGPVSFRKKDISDLDPARVMEIEVIDRETSWRLARLPGEPWTISEDTPILEGKDLSAKTVDQLLLALHRDAFRVGRYLPDLGDLARYGLELQAPRKGLILHRIDGQESPMFRKLVLGGPLVETQPPEVLARVDAAGAPPFTVEGDIQRLFDALAAHLRDVTGK